MLLSTIDNTNLELHGNCRSARYKTPSMYIRIYSMVFNNHKIPGNHLIQIRSNLEFVTVTSHIYLSAFTVKFGNSRARTLAVEPGNAS
jgi:hypothetical protein